MSTENSPQTLFRFVSLRNPNLSENSEKNLKFIFRPSKIEGYFDQVTSNTKDNRLSALIILANSFSKNSVKTLEELTRNENLAGLLKIGKYLSLEDEIPEKDLADAKNFYSNLKSDKETLQIIWDNLIYQFITQNNFYIKEAVSHILNAYHIGYVQTLDSDEELEKINGRDFIKVAHRAKIILSEFFFQEDIDISSKRTSDLMKSKNSNPQLLQPNLSKQESLYNQILDRENFDELKIELKSIENKASRNIDKDYQLAYEKYQKENAENIALYQNQLEVIQELEENKAPEEEIKKAYEELKRYEYPPFEYQLRKILNWTDLYSNLSEESFALFLENFTNAASIINKPIDYEKAKISIISDDEIEIDKSMVSITYNSYTEIYDEIDVKNQSLNQRILSDSRLPQLEFVNIGSVYVPVSEYNSASSPFLHLSYVLKATKPRSIFQTNTNNGYVTFQIQLENSSWNISYATLVAQTNLGTQNEDFSNLNVVNNTLTFPQLLKNKFKTISSLTINIFFSNGRESVLQLNNIAINQEVTGVLTLRSIKEDLPGITPTEPIPVSGNHFGIKRLGVAEYMKVVQTVHAYVPGEVSNIENVMASELRHKSINELTRTEETISTSKTQEIEKISDTTKTDRAEMQTEVAKELQKQQDFQAHANFSKNGVWKIDIGTAYATNNSQFTSNRQIVTKAQEITERAMERVQTKITEERILKIIQEVSLTNVHEFDNRGGLSDTRPQHITGVYRWVDKKMKNQIFNYGKRTMFEFMIPEPAKLHRLAYANSEITLKEPVDPRKAPAPYTMANANSATKALLEYWAGVYGINLTVLLPNSKQIIHNASGVPQTNNDFQELSSFQIPENYVAKNANFIGSSSRNRGGGSDGSRYSTLECSNLKGGFVGDSYRANVSFNKSVTGLNVTDNVEFKVTGHNVKNYTITATINCELSTDYINAWKLENFNAIINAYQTAYDEYKAEKTRFEAEQKANEDNQKEAQANFYRIIESDVLRHNCIAYLLQNYLNSKKLGDEFIYGGQMLNFKVNLSEDLDKYTATAKFLEQAFEWSIMDYTFYPYYWADRNMWQEMYLTESIDPLFRSFLQAGLARVIVTVKPGFEEAVQYFLTTGKVWLGGETPVIGDPLYVSIVQEMQESTGIPQGNYWITRIPTTLTILQDKSTGLPVTQPLPIFPEPNPENCENPEELETETIFRLDDVQMEASDKPTTLYPNA